LYISTLGERTPKIIHLNKTVLFLSMQIIIIIIKEMLIRIILIFF
jgi:hypothetical protein